MRKLVTADILPLIYNYLRSIGLKSFAEKLNNMSGLNLDEQKQNKMNGVQKKSVAESSEEESEEEEEEVVKQKNSKKNKKQNKIEKKRQQEDSEEDEDEEEEQVIVQKKPQKKVKVAQNVDDVTDTDQTTGAKFFSRIDESRIDSLRDELKDNTFEAKQKFGKGGDEHGRRQIKKQSFLWRSFH
ncbi:hypothetical protein PPERSA_07697 [Pseudocohnilembus persalinus]|uniref:Uncharacterized protein n=1 Tax=Pseudocohnilembus persalinus TaxID=266149 RepID=A0A0V0QIJ5_PSEPJ|nr:hypothetical protein PPERSA_07697 [Pseudocohnilembus persalinus]|eukprot:KRX02052.1 hypothetical protein PPERSA_07697 [Pseudocohnilembus persalinus]